MKSRLYSTRTNEQSILGNLESRAQAEKSRMRISKEFKYYALNR